MFPKMRQGLQTSWKGWQNIALMAYIGRGFLAGFLRHYVVGNAGNNNG